MKLALASLAAILAAPIAVAQGNAELSAGYTQFDADGADLGAITGRGTYFFNRYLGAEGEVSIGVDDASVGPGKVELDNSLGAFGVVRAPVTERLELFGRVGYAASEFNASVPGLGSASADVDGIAYGVGGKLFLTDRFGVRADVGRYEGDDSEADVFTIGGVVRF
ncbi:outer membrane beta-barrel protein [Hyphomonas sp.]|jgi:outer membrane immunogenic protein|uniref:outer membrane beta-barrel protein n=1 Tax=Hyphomonas sp. TaxID=87 RepID=UPI0025BE6F01|nr:outer membrane beta-barrel protein [Hyphomonas sp.]MBI1399541.1 outer membrane beta-barrel protein [Hyphomonas sp.]